MVRKNFGRQKSVYYSKSAKKWSKADKKKRDKANLLSRYYPLSGKIYGSVGTTAEIHNLVSTKKYLQRRELKYQIRAFPKYYLSQGRKKYYTQPRMMPYIHQQIPLATSPCIINVIRYGQSHAATLGLPQLGAYTFPDLIRKCMYLEANIERYLISDNQSPSSYLYDAVLMYAYYIGCLPSVLHYLGVVMDPHNQVLYDPVTLLKSMIPSLTITYWYEWITYMRTFYENYMHFMHLLLLYGISWEVSPDLGEAIVQFVGYCGYYTERAQRVVRFAPVEDKDLALDYAQTDYDSLITRLTRIAYIRKSLHYTQYYVGLSKSRANNDVGFVAFHSTNEASLFEVDAVQMYYAYSTSSRAALLNAEVAPVPMMSVLADPSIFVKNTPHTAVRHTIHSEKFTLREIISSCTSLNESRIWYERNGYELVKNKATIVLKPFGHYYDQGNSFSHTDDSDVTHLVGVTEIFQRVDLFEEFATLDAHSKAMVGSTQVSSAGVRQDLAALMINAKNPVLLETMGTNGITVAYKKTLFEQFSLIQLMYVQKYVPTTFVIDYDENMLANLGLQPSKVDRMLKDQIVTLIPDVVRITKDLIAKINEIFTKIGYEGVYNEPNDDKNFAERLYDSLVGILPYGGQNDGANSALYMIIYSCIKAVRINSRYVNKEYVKTSYAVYLAALKEYFYLLQYYCEYNNLNDLAIDIQVPKFRVKYAECISSITAHYMGPFNWVQSHEYRDTTINAFQKKMDSGGTIGTSSEVLNDTFYGLSIGNSRSKPGTLLSLLQYQSAITLQSLVTYKISYLNGEKMTDFYGDDSFLVLPKFDITTNFVYRRKQVIPGLHLLQFLDRGKYTMEISGGIRASLKPHNALYPTKMFGMLSEAKTLLTGVNYKAFMNEDLSTLSARVTSVSRLPKLYIKSVHLNLLSKTYIRMMQIVHNQGEFSVKTSTDAGQAVCAWRDVMDSVGVSGISMHNDHKSENYVVPFSLIFAAVGGSSTWSPLSEESMAFGNTDYTHELLLTPRTLHVHFGIDGVPAGYTLIALSVMHRLRTLIEQRLRMNGNFGELAKKRPASDLQAVRDKVMYELNPYLPLLPRPSRFDALNSMICYRNQALITLLVYKGAADKPGVKLLDAFKTFVNSISIDNNESMVDLLTWLDNNKEMRVIGQNLPATAYFNKLMASLDIGEEDSEVKAYIVRYYRLNTYASFVASALQQFNKRIKRFYSRHSYNPYWVDCYFGTYLSLGEQLNSDVYAEMFGTSDWTNKDRSHIIVNFPSFGGKPLGDVDYYVYLHSATTTRLNEGAFRLLDYQIMYAVMVGVPLDPATAVRVTYNLIDIGIASTARRVEQYAVFDQTYKAATQIMEGNFTVSDPSCAKFTTDMSHYDVPLYMTVKGDANPVHIQSKYTYKMHARAQPKSSTGYRYFYEKSNISGKYYYAALTAPLWALYLPQDQVYDHAPGGFVPLTILERLAFFFIRSNHIYEFKVQAVLSFNLMYKHFYDLCEMYVTCAYKKISDYDLFFVLCHMQTYLKEYTAVLQTILTTGPEILAKYEDDKLLHGVPVGMRARIESVTEAMKVPNNDYVVERYNYLLKHYEEQHMLRFNGVYGAMYMQIPHYRTAADRLETTNKEHFKMKKQVTKKYRQVMNSIVKQPALFDGKGDDFGDANYKVNSYTYFTTSFEALQQALLRYAGQYPDERDALMAIEQYEIYENLVPYVMDVNVDDRPYNAMQIETGVRDNQNVPMQPGSEAIYRVKRYLALDSSVGNKKRQSKPKAQWGKPTKQTQIDEMAYFRARPVAYPGQVYIQTPLTQRLSYLQQLAIYDADYQRRPNDVEMGY